jgi:hypothetical protein
MTAGKLIALGVLTIFCLLLGTPASPQGAVSLCEKGEKVIFTCAIQKPARIGSLCSSPNVTKEQGYVQYRFGLPGKIELEFPKTRARTQAVFKYSHYFRAQVDETEISFTSDAYQYAIFDDYNGEQKPASHDQGVRVTAPDGKETTLSCRGRAKADYSNLGDVLPTETR